MSAQTPAARHRTQAPAGSLLAIVSGRRAIATAVLLACTAAPALAVDRNWFGGSGAWDDAGNWSPAGVPGATDRAFIASGNAGLSFAQIVGGLEMTGGTISGSGQLTVLGAASLSAGTLSGAGATRFEGALALTGNGLRTILGGRTIQTLGATTWGGNSAANSGNIRFDTGGGLILNDGDWTDSHVFDVTLGSGPAITTKRFDNRGTYTKTGAGITDAMVAFDNAGTVSVQAGQLALRGAADSTSKGSFHIASGATLSFGRGSGSVGLATLDGVSFSGSGRLMVDANNSSPVDLRLLGTSRHEGLLEVASGQFDIAGRFDVGSFLQTGGAVQGAGLLVVEGAATYIAGQQAGSGTTRFAGPLTIGGSISGAGEKILAGGRTLETHGTTTWGGGTASFATRILMNTAATIVNHGAWLDSNAFDSSIGSGISGSAKHFDNLGTYTKTGAGTVDLDVAFANLGSVDVQAGRLALSGAADSTSTGHFKIAEGATLSFGRAAGSSGTATLDGVTFGGSGRVQIDANNSPAVDVRLLGSSSHIGELRLTHGHFAVDGSFTVGGYAQTGGVLQGEGLVVVTGAAVIEGGTQSGPGTTRFGGDLLITGNGDHLIAAGRRVEANGTTTWTGNTGAFGNDIQFNGAATIVNRGTWIDANAYDTQVGSGSGGSVGKWFINEGAYVKTGSGTTQWAAGFVNLGSLRVGAGAVMQLNQASFVNEGALAGHGTLQVPGVVNRGLIAPGSSTGTLSLSGDLILAPEGTLSVELASLTDFDRLVVGGSVGFGGSLEVVALGYTAVLGDSFVIMDFAQRSGDTAFDQIVWVGFGSGVVFDAVYGPQDLTLRVAAVPEPAGWMLALAGLAMIGARVRRQRRIER